MFQLDTFIPYLSPFSNYLMLRVKHILFSLLHTGVLCPDPISPTDGIVTYATPMHTPHVGSIILYTCNDGFALVGNSMAECQLNGNWSNPIPKCFQGIIYSN